MTIEVFKTNVCQADTARRVIQMIGEAFKDYRVNFDLDDCDHILRVVSSNGEVQSTRIIQMMKQLGLHAELLP